MGKSKTVSERLHEVRLAYEKELAEKKKYYSGVLADIDEQIRQKKGKAYDTGYKMRYSQLAQGMEALFSRIRKTEEKTHGLKFTTEEYLRSLPPVSIPKGKVEEVFADVAERAKSVLGALSRNMDAEAYEPFLKKYCELLATVRYINKEADKLLNESGLPERDRACELAPLLEKQRDLQAEQANALKTENMSCYPEMTAVRTEIRKAAARVKDDMLGSGKFRFDPEYRYLLGFRKEKIPSDDLGFATDILGLASFELNCHPIYFEPESGKKNIIINVHGRDFNSPLYKNLVRNIYLSIAGRLPGNCLQFNYIACDVTSNAYFKILKNNVDSLGTQKDKTKGGKYIYRDSVEDANRVSDALRQYIGDSTDTYASVRKEGNIYGFNRIADFDRKPFRLIYIDNYPAGFSASGDSVNLLGQLLESEYCAGSGFWTVVGQNVDAPKESGNERFYNAPAPLLKDGEKSRAVIIDITDPAHITVDGCEADLGIALSGFDELKYWEQLNAYYIRKEDFFIDKLFSESDRAVGGKVCSPFDSGHLQIPLGYRGKQLYEWDLDLKQACHIFIVGGSGYGKTSFVHTFILSTAYKYSPKEVQFYLADWKGAEFAFYKPWEKAAENGIDVKALPHVRYLQDKNSLGDYVTFMQMVYRITAERNNLFINAGCQDIIGYNRIMDSRGEARMPFLFVIVDEYQTMLNSVAEGKKANSDRIKESWVELVQAILSIARSAGVALVLCAQKEENSISLANVQHRVVMGSGENPAGLIRSTLYDGDRNGEYTERIESDRAYLSVRQEGRALIGKSSDKNSVNIRTAYSGDHAQRAPMTLLIAEKHKCEMPPRILGGNEELFGVDEISNPPYEHMNDPVLLPGAVLDSDDDFAPDLYDRSAFPLYIGVSTTDAYPTALQFSTDNGASGFAVYTALKVRMNRILNSVMLSFLFKTGALKYAYSLPRISYFGTAEAYGMDIGRTVERNPFLGRHISYYNVKSDIGNAVEQLIKLNELREQRDETDRPEDGFTPLMVVIHDLEWLTKEILEKRLQKLWNDREEEAAAARKASASGVSEEAIREGMDELRADYRDAGIPYTEERLRADVIAGLEGKAAPVVEVRHYTVDEVRTAVKELFKKGNRVGIFVVAASDVKDDLSKFHRELLGEDNGRGFDRIIYGSYTETVNRLENGDEDDGGEPDTVCYVYPGGVKTRIYSYNVKGNPVWWQKLEKYLK